MKTDSNYFIYQCLNYNCKYIYIYKYEHIFYIFIDIIFNIRTDILCMIFLVLTNEPNETSNQPKNQRTNHPTNRAAKSQTGSRRALDGTLSDSWRFPEYIKTNDFCNLWE